MLSHYLLTFYRALTRHRLYAALNVLGLAVGIAVFLVLWLDVRFETGFERWIPNAGSIYLIRTTFPDEPIDSYALARGTSAAVLDALKGDYPGIVATRVWDQEGTVRQAGRVTPEVHIEVVDPDFFKVFDLPLVAGDKATLFRAPDEVVITQTRARRYFGEANPMGRSLTIVTQGIPNVYRVAGVLKDPPPDTESTFDLILPLTPAMTATVRDWTNWYSEELETFLRFEDPAGARALDRDLDGFVDRHVAHELGRVPHKEMKLRTQPQLSLHLLDPKAATVVAAIAAVGLLTLIMAAVNYVNLATARAGLRAREVALRKVMGATGQTLVWQFMGEALATVFLAAIIGLALCELALPLINTVGGPVAADRLPGAGKRHPRAAGRGGPDRPGRGRLPGPGAVAVPAGGGPRRDALAQRRPHRGADPRRAGHRPVHHRHRLHGGHRRHRQPGRISAARRSRLQAAGTGGRQLVRRSRGHRSPADQPADGVAGVAWGRQRHGGRHGAGQQ